MWGGFFFQAEGGIRDLVRSRGLGDVYKRHPLCTRNGTPYSGQIYRFVVELLCLSFSFVFFDERLIDI